jgi:hypothetical protein
VVIDSTVKEKMKAVMTKRYNAGLKTLDLTQFYEYPDLTDTAIALNVAVFWVVVPCRLV